jgi:hypothetical protein
LWLKELNAKDMHKAKFPVYGGKHFSRKPVQNWVKAPGKPFTDVE